MGLSPLSQVSLLSATQTNAGTLGDVANSLKYGTNASLDSPHWQRVGDALTQIQSQFNTILTALRSPIPTPSVYQLTDASGNLIAQIGNTIDPTNNQSYPGIWAADAYFGGSGPSTSQVQINAGSTVKVVIVGATVTVTLEPQTDPSGNPAGLSIVNNTGPNPFESFIGDRQFSLVGSGGQQSIFVTTGYQQILGHYLNRITCVNTSGQTTLDFHDGGTNAGLTLNDNSGVTQIHLANTTASLSYFVPNVGFGNQTSPNYPVDALGDINYTGSLRKSGTAISLTVNTDATAVKGTPGTGQSNFTAVTGVTLNA